MNLDDLWSDCCDYLKREGWGDLGFLKADNPSEYQSVRKFFEAMKSKFESSPDDFKGVGSIKGVGNLPPVVGTFLFPYGMAQLYEPGNLYRRYLLARSILDLKEELRGGTGRRWAETDSMALERLVIPRSEQLRQERAHRPDGADSAVSRAGVSFRSDVWDKWRGLTGLSPWTLGVFQFFVWKKGNVVEDESKLAQKIADDLALLFNEALAEATKELEQYGPPSPEELRAWIMKYHDDLKQELAQNPRLLPLLIPFILGFGQQSSNVPRRRRGKKRPATK